MVSRVVGHTRVLIRRSGPAARGWGHPARMITSPSGHYSILSYADSLRSKPVWLGRRVFRQYGGALTNGMSKVTLR